MQIYPIVLIWTVGLTISGVSTFFSLADIKKNRLETYRWQAETLAQKIMRDMRLQIGSDELSASETEGLKRVSLKLQQILERHIQAAPSSIGIIDTRGYWVAHQKTGLRNTPVKNSTLVTFFKKEETALLNKDDLYHILIPVTIGKEISLGMIDVMFGTEYIQREKRHYIARNAAIFFIVSCVTCGVLLCASRKNMQAIQSMTCTAEMIHNGDFRFPTGPIPGSGDIRTLALTFHKMTVRLRTVSTHVQQTVVLIATAVKDMQSAAERLAASLEEQSASIAQTSMNMERVARESQHISQSTDTVVRIAEKTKADAQQGLQIAEDTLDKMRDIQQSNHTDTENIQSLGQKSQEISKIMDVIVSIADQTKLIAFNASLEASGAGIAGKRFGIVAKEIRTLADHVIGSTTTIQETTARIQDSIQTLNQSSETSTENIRQGAEYTVRTKEWLQEILAGTTKTTRIAQRISRSLLKQQLASEEISTSLKELLRNIDEFAKTGTMTNDIANRLEGFTKDLEKLLKDFKI